MLGTFAEALVSLRVIDIVKRADAKFWDLKENAKIPQKLVATTQAFVEVNFDEIKAWKQGKAARRSTNIATYRLWVVFFKQYNSILRETSGLEKATTLGQLIAAFPKSAKIRAPNASGDAGDDDDGGDDNDLDGVESKDDNAPDSDEGGDDGGAKILIKSIQNANLLSHIMASQDQLFPLRADDGQPPEDDKAPDLTDDEEGAVCQARAPRFARDRADAEKFADYDTDSYYPGLNLFRLDTGSDAVDRFVLMNREQRQSIHHSRMIR